MDPIISSAEAADIIRTKTSSVVDEINAFTSKVFRTRGGRLGSGMGLLLEGLWGYHMTAALDGLGLEIAWIADDQYNDYAAVLKDSDWDPETLQGELFRIEAKTMNLGADESKAHFAELQSGIGPNDLLLVIMWSWELIEGENRSWPKIEDVFIDRALEIAHLRDELHLCRGGTFVSKTACPDGCSPTTCIHDGEPLNAQGKRERVSGPSATRVSANVSFAANFGGLFRMIGTSTKASKDKLKMICAENPVADRYVKFVTRNRGR